MTLSTIARPFAQFQGGQASERDGMRTGLHLGLLYRSPDGSVGLIWRKPSMPAPAFSYFPSLFSAWAVFKRLRAEQRGPEPRLTLRDALIAQGLTPEQITVIERQTRRPL